MYAGEVHRGWDHSRYRQFQKACLDDRENLDGPFHDLDFSQLTRLDYQSMIETLHLDTKKKSQSQRSRKSRQFQKVSLDIRDISIEIEKSRYCLDTTIQIQISRSRLRFFKTYQDLPKISIISWSRLRSSYNFHKSWSRLLLLIHFTNRLNYQSMITKVASTVHSTFKT